MSNSNEDLQNLIEKLKSIKDAMNYDISFHNLAKELESEINILSTPLTFMVMGSFSVGKSSFINAILGKKVAQVKATPTTAVITRFIYGKNETTTVYYNDDRSEVISESDFEKFTAETTKQDKFLRKNIKYVERVLNIDFLKKFTIIDSPGLNSNQLEHNDITKTFVDNADFVVWMLDAHWAAGANEIGHLQGLNKRFKPIVVVNQMDSLDEEEGDDPEELLEDIRIKCGKNVIDVIGVSAKMAIEGIERNNDNLWKESNVKGFFDILDKYITTNGFFFKLDHIMELLPNTLSQISKNKIELDTEDLNLRKNHYDKYIERWKKSMNLLSRTLWIKFENWEICDLDDKFLNNLFEENLLALENKYNFIHSLNWGRNILLASNDIRNAVFQNDPQAQYDEAMALRYEFGKGSSGEIYWLILSGENGYSPAFKELYTHYRDVNDTQNAMKWLELAAPKDDFAVACLAYIFYFGENNVKRDKKNAIPWLLKAMANRDYCKGELSFALANEYCDGIYVEKDYLKAFELFNKSYEEGKLNALKNIGDCYYYGLGVETDKIIAFLKYFNGNFKDLINNLYINNAENYPLQIEIAKNFQHGINGFKKSIENAKKWFKIAFNHGNKEAGFLRGNIEENEETANKWYFMTAEKHYGPAEKIMGDLVLNKGGWFKRCKSFKYYLRSAMHGYSMGFFNAVKQSGIIFSQIILFLFIIHNIISIPLEIAYRDKDNILYILPDEEKVTFLNPINTEINVINGLILLKNSNFSNVKKDLENEKSIDEYRKLFDINQNRINILIENLLTDNDIKYSFAYNNLNYNEIEVNIQKFNIFGHENLYRQLKYSEQYHETAHNNYVKAYEEYRIAEQQSLLHEGGKNETKFYNEYLSAKSKLKEAIEEVNNIAWQKMRNQQKITSLDIMNRLNYNNLFIHFINDNKMYKYNDNTLFFYEKNNKSKLTSLNIIFYKPKEELYNDYYYKKGLYELYCITFKVPYNEMSKYSYTIYQLYYKLRGEL